MHLNIRPSIRVSEAEIPDQKPIICRHFPRFVIQAAAQQVTKDVGHDTAQVYSMDSKPERAIPEKIGRLLQLVEEGLASRGQRCQSLR
jgi:hypothetical protein